jgi:Holliday junction resolvase RusA-like endonuclease
MQKKYILKITPQTNVRATQGDRVFFRIPREKLRPAGLSRLLRLEKYNDYKESVAALCRQQRFSIPEQNVHMIFYIPVPKTWKEYKKKEMHMKLHQQKPDIDNLVKAVFDSVFSEDKYIADFRATKRWVNKPEGWIEFIVDLPEFPSKDVLI